MPGRTADPANAPLHFEIEGLLDLDATVNMPGSPPTDTSRDGRRRNSYISHPAGGLHPMVVNHDDAFSMPRNNPRTHLRVELGANAGATTTSFYFLVQQAGTYPFRTVWENGSGGSVIRWYTSTQAHNVLINDLSQGGIPAYRQRHCFRPYVKGANLQRYGQLESTAASVSVVLVDGRHGGRCSVTFSARWKARDDSSGAPREILDREYRDVAGFQAAGEAHTGCLPSRIPPGLHAPRMARFTISKPGPSGQPRHG